ncbi:translation initiation factor IF-2-like [Rousettus aegyptiacus]|uniref:translation initiation factor IF-2-like n=1 Tax=Rousettus aegyptiacus TaxID=9407 RepID=UPI00168D8163|nr:translation initiation factor IF-2-like [Rousettus aegyptiacus]
MVWGAQGEKTKKRGAHPSRPLGAAGSSSRDAGGRRAGPGRARPQARLIFMSGREAPLLHGRRPDPAPAAGLCALRSSRPASLARTRGRGPPAPARRPPPAPALAGQSGRRWREGREPATSRAPHPPAGAAPSRLRRKMQQTRTGGSGASGSARNCPAPGPRAPHARREPVGAGRRPGAARRRAPRPPPPASRSQAPPRPAPAGPGLSAAAGGRGAGRRPPDSPLASPGRAGAALGRPRSPSDRSASLRSRAELFPGGGFLASSSLDPPPPTPPPSPPLPRGGSGAEYFLS